MIVNKQLLGILNISLLAGHAIATFSSYGCYPKSALIGLTLSDTYIYQSSLHCQGQCGDNYIAAMTNGNECYCASGISGSADSSGCDSICDGYKMESCGGNGNDFFTVFVNSAVEPDDSESSSSDNESSTTSSSSSSSSSLSSTESSSSSSSEESSSSSSSSLISSSLSTLITTASPSSSSTNISSSSSSSTTSSSSLSSSSSSTSSSATTSSSTTSSSSSSTSSSSTTSSSTTTSSSSSSSSSSSITTSSSSSSTSSSITTSSTTSIPTKTTTSSSSTSVEVLVSSIVIISTSISPAKTQTAIITIVQSTTTTPSPVANTLEDKNNKTSHKLSGGAIAGIVIGVVFGLLFLLLGLLFLLRRRKTQDEEITDEKSRTSMSIPPLSREPTNVFGNHTGFGHLMGLSGLGMVADDDISIGYGKRRFSQSSLPDAAANSSTDSGKSEKKGLRVINPDFSDDE